MRNINEIENIFAFVPGTKTGYVWYKVESKSIIEFDTFEGYGDICDTLKNIKDLFIDNSIVIYEKNTIEIMRTPEQFNTIKKVGLIEGYCIGNNMKSEGQISTVTKEYIKTAKINFYNVSNFSEKQYEIQSIKAYANILSFLDNVNI